MLDQKTINRFFKKVIVVNECWEWIAYKSNGYGRFRFKNKSYRSNRISYMIYYKVDPRHLSVCHSCDNRSCVNPSHLFLGSHQDNIKDMVEKNRQNNGNARKTHCVRGHEFNKENTYVRKNGSRKCRKCCQKVNLAVMPITGG